MTRNFKWSPLSNLSLKYEHSQWLELIITVLHFWVRGSWMCYTCIIAFTGGLVESSNPVQQSSPAIQSSDPVHNPVQRLETTIPLLLLEMPFWTSASFNTWDSCTPKALNCLSYRGFHTVFQTFIAKPNHLSWSASFTAMCAYVNFPHFCVCQEQHGFLTSFRSECFQIHRVHFWKIITLTSILFANVEVRCIVDELHWMKLRGPRGETNWKFTPEQKV